MAEFGELKTSLGPLANCAVLSLPVGADLPFRTVTAAADACTLCYYLGGRFSCGCKCFVHVASRFARRSIDVIIACCDGEDGGDGFIEGC